MRNDGGYVFDPTKGTGNIGYGSGPLPKVALLSATTASFWCKSCHRVSDCEVRSVKRDGSWSQTWRCTRCGNAPHETPVSEQRIGKRFS